MPDNDQSPRIFVDAGFLIARRHLPPSGVTRVNEELLRHFEARPHGVGVYHDRRSGAYRAVSIRALTAMRALPHLGKRSEAASPMARLLRLLQRLKVALAFRRLLGEQLTPQAGDLYLSVGMKTWSPAERVHLHELAQRGVRVVTMVHDIIPLRRPDITVEFLHERFEPWLRDTLSFSSSLLTPSRWVAQDIERYLAEHGLPAPTIHPVALPPGLDPATPPAETPRLTQLAARPFVLMTSSFALRKNQRFAVRLWQRLHSEFGIITPMLVLCGTLNDPSLLQELEAQDGWNEFAAVITDASDGELAWLYANARFTLFPSMAEGWGLPITEALAFGRYCLAADNTSLPEAGQGLSFHAALDDPDSWLAELRRVVTDPDYLTARTAHVAASYRPRTWADYARDVETALIR